MVSNYTSHKKPRLRDGYSPGRQDRASSGQGDDRLCQSCPGGLRLDPYRHRRYRGEPSPARPLRLVGQQGEAVDPPRREGRHTGVRHGGEAGREIAGRLARGDDLAGIPGTAIVRKEVPPGRRCSSSSRPVRRPETTRRSSPGPSRLISENQDPFRERPWCSGTAIVSSSSSLPPSPLSEKELDAVSTAFPNESAPIPPMESARGCPGLRDGPFLHRFPPRLLRRVQFLLPWHASGKDHPIAERQSRSSREARIALRGWRVSKGPSPMWAGPPPTFTRPSCARWTEKGALHRHGTVSSRRNARCLKLGLPGRDAPLQGHPEAAEGEAICSWRAACDTTCWLRKRRESISSTSAATTSAAR